MARQQIEVKGVLVDLRNPTELIEGINQVLDCKTEQATDNEAITEEGIATLSFFGSLKHYLEGGIDNEW